MPEGRSEQYHAVGRFWLVCGDDLGKGTMILALAMRHSVERPAIRMGGGHDL